MNPIAVYMAPGEGAREGELRAALKEDKRFGPLEISASNIVDLQFSIDRHIPVEIADKQTNINVPKRLNIELKEPSDWVSSVLSGHLYEQVLSCREARQDACIVILGDLGDIQAAIKDASQMRAGKYLRGAELGHAIASTHARCKSFRKRSMLNGVPVFYKNDDSGFFDGDDQWKDILELAHDFLLDGHLMGFAQRPANEERELIAASFLFRDVGAKTLAPIMDQYRLVLVPRGEYAKPIEEFAGVGPKRAKAISERVVMFYEH